MENRILTLHPEGKQGVNIQRAKYNMIRDAILKAIRSQGEVTLDGLTSLVAYALRDRFEGSIPWYVRTVKLDMEARREIERVPGSSPQRVRIVRESFHREA